MKKLLLCSILFFCMAQAFSQNNYARHNQNDYPGGVLTIGNLTFYTTTEGESLDQKSHLYGVNNNKLKFKYDLPYAQTAYITDLKKCPNGNVGMAGYYRPQCDVLYYKVFYAEVDTNGVQQTLMTIFLPSPISVVRNVKIFEWISGDKILAADSALILSQNGGLSPFKANLGDVNSIYEDQAKHIGYIHHSVGGLTPVNYFTQYDLPTVDSITTIPFPYKITKMMKGANKFYYGLTDSSYVVKFDTLFNIIANSKLNQGPHQLNDFDLKQDTIYACAKNSLSMIKLDQSLNMVYQYQNTQSLIKFAGIDVTNNSAAFIATEEANNTVVKYTNSLLTRTKLNGKIELKNDAFVESVMVASGQADAFPPNLPFPSPQYINISYSLMAKVRNNGVDTLKSVYLNSMPRDYYSYICPYYLNHYLDTTILIPPGQFGYVTMPTYNDRFLVYPNQQPVNDSLSFITCVWTSAPNFNGDNDHLNDALCNAVIKLPVAVGLNEYNRLSSFMKIFPNPATQHVSIQFLEYKPENFDDMKLNITNMLGQIIKTETLTSSNSTINIAALETGMYVIQVTKNGKPVYQSKLVKN